MSVKAIKLVESCIKTLSLVEVTPSSSNQHELNGVKELKSILGEARLESEALFSIRGKEGITPVNVTWYDSRQNTPHRAPEYRLYFESNNVMEAAKEGDAIAIGYDENRQLRCELITR